MYWCRMHSRPSLWSCLVAVLMAAASVQGQLDGCSAKANHWEHIIDEDLEPFASSGISRQLVESSKQFSGGGMHVLIVNNTLYVKAFGNENPDSLPGHGALHLLLRALCYHDLPDVEFILDPNDGPQTAQYNKALPVLAWSKNRLHRSGISYPYWSFNSLEDSVARLEDRDMSWEDRIPKAVWRGSTTGASYTKFNWKRYPRSQLVQHAMHAPEVMDVAFSDVQVQASAAASDAMITQSKVLPAVDMGAMSRYKYIIICDGNAAPSSRMATLMFSGSALFKQESPYEEFFYSDLKPYHHYIPLSYYMTDVVLKVHTARQHDRQLKQIAANARQYAETKLTAPNIACYVHRILVRYAKLQRFRPKLDDAWRQLELHIGEHEHAWHMQMSRWDTCKQDMTRYI